MSIDVAVEDGICTIVINRPERMNAMDAEHYKGLSQGRNHRYSSQPISRTRYGCNI